jgi:putative ABC transport system permease protein
MLDLDFRQGSAAEAKRMLKLGRHIVITQEFRQLKGLGVFEKRTVASLFGTIDDAREFWGVNKVRVFAANLDAPIEKAAMVDRIKKHVGGCWGMDAADVRHIKHGIQQTLSQLLMLVSVVAYAAMVVASLGVANTIMASIRSRRWHFGVLRSIGVTRGQLLRIVLAEAVLLGLVGVVMGLLAGLEMSIDARQSSARFIGFLPPLLIPWGTILVGVAAVMVVSLCASLWPAVNVAKSEPLRLLQAGRAAV